MDLLTNQRNSGGEKVPITGYLPRVEHDELRTLAQEQDLSLAAVVRRGVRLWIATRKVEARGT